MSEFNYSTLISRAGLQSGDLWEGPWQEALHHLLNALANEAALSPERQEITQQQLTYSLAMRKHIQDVPGVPELQTTPIVIVGFPRTGTTLLQNLLASHPEHTAHPLWALRRPLWNEQNREGAIADAQAWLKLLYKLNPEFPQIHPMHALRPDECSWLFRQSFATMVYAYQDFIPSYVAWLQKADIRWAYAEYKCQLAHLEAGPYLLLKDPCHLWHLDALLDTFPNALIIQLHRKPEKFIPSLASLCSAMQSFGTINREPVKVGQYAFELAHTAMQKMLAVRSPDNETNFLDIGFSELISDPIATCTKICSHIGTSISPGILHRIEDFLDDNPRDKHGIHHYNVEKFGIGPEKIDDFFDPYVTRFRAQLKNEAL